MHCINLFSVIDCPSLFYIEIEFICYSTHPFKVYNSGTSLVVQWLRLHIPSTGGLGSVLFRELDPHATTKSSHTATKSEDATYCNSDPTQPNKYFLNNNKVHNSVVFSRSTKLWKHSSEVDQSCPTLCNPMDWSLPGSSIHGIFQARVLEWVAISFSRGSSQPRDRTQVSRVVGRCFLYCLSHQGSPVWKHY